MLFKLQRWKTSVKSLTQRGILWREKGGKLVKRKRLWFYCEGGSSVCQDPAGNVTQLVCFFHSYCMKTQCAAFGFVSQKAAPPLLSSNNNQLKQKVKSTAAALEPEGNTVSLSSSTLYHYYYKKSVCL